jgi:predicted Zn-dependent peptidase
LKRRANAKLNKNEILSRVSSYAKFGAVSPSTYLLSEQELKALKGEDLTALLKSLPAYKHKIDYYGPSDSAMVISGLNKSHKIIRSLKDPLPAQQFKEESTDDSKVFFVNYEMKQAEVNFLSKGGAYDRNLQPIVSLYSRYFGGGMSSPVFQTLRESKALAYAVSSRYSAPSRPDRSYYNTAYIGTQADKLPEAMAGMMELLQDMPAAQKTFENAKEGALQGIATDRITKDEVLRLYHSLKRMGVNYDLRKDMYEGISKMTLEDVVAFQKKMVKDKKYRIAMIGNREKVDFKVLEKYGQVVELDLQQVFGY